MNEIPKIIHYCWFGKKEKSDKIKKMIDSWRKNCPEYEIIEWNEENFDIHINKYAEQAYEKGKYAFVADVARVYALTTVGGIYLDTDVEILKPLDDILNADMIIGFQDKVNINTGLIISKKNNKFMQEMLEQYSTRNFIKADGNLDVTTNVRIFTNSLVAKGLILNDKMQILEGIKIYPSDYFCPIDYESGKKNITSSTYAIHWFESSWLPEHIKYRKKITRVIYRIFGKDCLNWLKKK